MAQFYLRTIFRRFQAFWHSTPDPNYADLKGTAAQSIQKTFVKLGAFDRIQENWQRKKSNHQAPTEVASRIRWVAAYIEWLLKRRLGELHRKSEDTFRLREHGQAALKQLRFRIPRSSSPVRATELQDV